MAGSGSAQSSDDDYPSGGGCGGCLGIVILFFTALVLVGMLFRCTNGQFANRSYSSSTTSSTTVREALPEGSVSETAYYTDEDGDWIHSASTLESGMRTFYDKTGVQPYLYILPNDQTTSQSELESRASSLYDELFTDEAHFLFVFCYDSSDDSYYYAYLTGSLASQVMDSEAVDIFLDKLDYNWYEYGQGDEDDMFSATFSEAASAIMEPAETQSRNALLGKIALGVGLVVVVVVIIVFIRRKNAQKAEENRKRVDEVLNTPLEEFGDKNLEDLADKYENSTEASSAATTSGEASASSNTSASNEGTTTTS